MKSNLTQGLVEGLLFVAMMSVIYVLFAVVVPAIFSV